MCLKFPSMLTQPYRAISVRLFPYVHISFNYTLKCGYEADQPSKNHGIILLLKSTCIWVILIWTEAEFCMFLSFTSVCYLQCGWVSCNYLSPSTQKPVCFKSVLYRIPSSLDFPWISRSLERCCSHTKFGNLWNIANKILANKILQPK